MLDEDKRELAHDLFWLFFWLFDAVVLAGGVIAGYTLAQRLFG